MTIYVLAFHVRVGPTPQQVHVKGQVQAIDALGEVPVLMQRSHDGTLPQHQTNSEVLPASLQQRLSKIEGNEG